MKFGQLLEYSMGNIFREKSYPKYGEETIPWPFSKKSKDRFLLAHIKLVLKTKRGLELASMLHFLHDF